MLQAATLKSRDTLMDLRFMMKEFYNYSRSLSNNERISLLFNFKHFAKIIHRLHSCVHCPCLGLVFLIAAVYHIVVHKVTINQ